jgi:hypothetical protein
MPLNAFLFLVVCENDILGEGCSARSILSQKALNRALWLLCFDLLWTHHDFGSLIRTRHSALSINRYANIVANWEHS